MVRLLLIVAAALAALALSGCGMTITPPAAGTVADPVQVFIADHGIHTSLVLPREDGTVVEFAYSRFTWAALDQDQWYRSLGALLVPGDGAIGTRDFPGPPTRDSVLQQFELAGVQPAIKELYVVPNKTMESHATVSPSDGVAA